VIGRPPRAPSVGNIDAQPQPADRRLGWRALAATSLLSLAACQTPPTTGTRPPTSDDCSPSGAPLASTQAAQIALAATATGQATSPSGHPRAPQAPGPALALQGQLSVKLEAIGDQAAKGLSLGFFFNGRASDGQMDLMTLMGSQVARLQWSTGHAELTDGNGPHHYTNLAALSEAALGEALPLDTLIHWMQGRADPALPVQIGRDPGTFEQLGWLIDTSQLDEKKLSATRSATPALRGVRIKVYLDR
jgi:outer membrane biogenesis lipoprotein LolB